MKKEERIREGVQGVSRGESGHQKHSHPRGIGHVPARWRQRLGGTRLCHLDDLGGYAQRHLHDYAQKREEEKPHFGQGKPQKRQKETALQRALCKGSSMMGMLALTFGSSTLLHCSRQQPLTVLSPIKMFCQGFLRGGNVHGLAAVASSSLVRKGTGRSR